MKDSAKETVLQVIYRPRSAIVAGLGLLVGVVITYAAEVFLRSGRPNLITVESVAVTPAAGPAPNGYNLEVRTAVSPPDGRDCLRETQHVIYRDTRRTGDAFLRDYVPLSVGMGGAGFSSVPNFVVNLYIPPTVDKGVWSYVNRSVYLCTVFPWFIRITQTVTEPKTIILD